MASMFSPTFAEIPEDQKIETMKFLETSQQISVITDLLGGKLFAPLKKDLITNVEKIKKRFLENPIKFATLGDIIEAEKQETDKRLKAVDGNGIATNALIWLTRGLNFILHFLEHLTRKDYDENLENLKSAVRLAYKASLQEHHGWVVGKLVSAMTNATPYRKDFVRDLAAAEGFDEEETLSKAAKFAELLRANIETVHELYKKTGTESTVKA